jgi:hypothetical protein
MTRGSHQENLENARRVLPIALFQTSEQ